MVITLVFINVLEKINLIIFFNLNIVYKIILINHF